MKKQQAQSIISLINRLKRQKYSLPAIIVIVAATVVTSTCEDKDKPLVTTDKPTTTANQCEVVSTYDGDTITVKCTGKENIKVRFYCIDTPEIKQQPWGEQSRDHLRSIIGNTVSIVEIDKDRYGRTVGEVYNGSLNLNLAMVEAGKAAVYDAYCKKPEYKVAEEKAKQAKKGIWSTPGLHQTPWKWRN